MPPVEVEYSDKPEWGPLTVSHLHSQLLVHGLLLSIAIVVWVGELCVGGVPKRKNPVNDVTHDVEMRWLEK